MFIKRPATEHENTSFWLRKDIQHIELKIDSYSEYVRIYTSQNGKGKQPGTGMDKSLGQVLHRRRHLAYKQMKRSSISLVFREVQIETTMKYPSTLSK